LTTLNIKLISVASNINGQTSRKLLDMLLGGQEITTESVAERIHPRMMMKLDELVLSIQGVTTPLQKET